MENTENAKKQDVEKNTEEKRRKRKIILIILLVIFLFLILVRLFYEFRIEKQRMLDMRAKLLQEESPASQEGESSDENGNLRALIDSLCAVYPDDCERFKGFSDIAQLLTFSDGLQQIRDENERREAQRAEEAIRISDSLRLLRERETADSLRLIRERERQISDSIAAANREREIADSLAKARQREEETAARTAQNEAACRDLSPLWVYPEPAGGLHFEPIRVNFSLSRPASVYYKRSRNAEFRLWGGEDILISQNTELFFRAADECGNVFSEQKTVYAFGERRAQNACPPNMALIQSVEEPFCIDQFLWPNERGALPMNLVSHGQARDLCASVGKRLCSDEEWTAACRGPNNWRFPYGDNFLPWACVTQDTTFRRSGEASACRSWYAVFDMSGNLAEWTNTRAPSNNRFFVVKGGFWESGQSANCQQTRFSYHPQNRHNPVGFRCCKNLAGSVENGE